MGVVLGARLVVNSTACLGGSLGSSTENISGNFATTRIMYKSLGLDLDSTKLAVKALQHPTT